ncbi:MAG: DUF99 domain-containing protein [Thermoprotei archaeon]|nr:MAG: DUF99 domain-containing protein [Thermoprotei archaeon]
MVSVFKKGFRTLGIAESYVRGVHKYSLLAGVIMRSDLIIDGFTFTYITVGGFDSTERILSMYRNLNRNDINLIMLNGAIIGWYNIVDIYKLYNCIRKPIIVVSYEESEGIEKYIKKYFPQDYKERLELYRKLGEREMIKIKTGYKVYIRYIGIDKKQAIVALNRLTLNGSIPEPLRVAKILAHAAIKAKQ